MARTWPSALPRAACFAGRARWTARTAPLAGGGLAGAASIERIGGSVATRVEPGRAGGHPPAPRAIRDLPDGSPTTSLALSGELMAVSTQQPQRQQDSGAKQPNIGRWRRFTGVAVCLLPFTAGCAWDKHLFTSPPAPPPPVDSLVLRGDKLEADNSVKT